MDLTAASSTRAVWARNFGLAFMALLSRTNRRGAKDQPFNASLRRHYPHQVRRVCSHPPRQVCPVRTPTLLEGTLLQAVGVGKPTINSTAGPYCEREPDAVALAFAAIDRARGKRSN